MKKSVLVDMLEKGILKEQSSTKYLYDTYCLRIANLLEFIKDGDTEIKNISALDGFSEKGAFDNYVRDHAAEETESLLKQIESGVRDWVRNARETIDYGEKLRAEAHGKRRVAFWIFIGLFILFSAVAAVFSYLYNAELLEGVAKKVAAACVTLDFVNGVAAIVYELIDDRKSKRRDYAEKQAIEFGLPFTTIIGKLDNKGTVNFYFDRNKDSDNDNRSK